ncbi:MAG TPA: hypothetical protein VM689_16555, partial [Aliidongia sp.]|nr:hypothetical protein [Aliidongia sp.]
MMRKPNKYLAQRSLMLGIGSAFLFLGPAYGADDLVRLSGDAKQWVMPTGDYANHRHSTLSQINAS